MIGVSGYLHHRKLRLHDSDVIGRPHTVWSDLGETGICSVLFVQRLWWRWHFTVRRGANLPLRTHLGWRWRWHFTVRRGANLPFRTHLGWRWRWHFTVRRGANLPFRTHLGWWWRWFLAVRRGANLPFRTHLGWRRGWWPGRLIGSGTATTTAGTQAEGEHRGNQHHQHPQGELRKTAPHSRQQNSFRFIYSRVHLRLRDAPDWNTATCENDIAPHSRHLSVHRLPGYRPLPHSLHSHCRSLTEVRRRSRSPAAVPAARCPQPGGRQSRTHQDARIGPSYSSSLFNAHTMLRLSAVR